jgi:cytoskeletal protein RodZ
MANPHTLESFALFTVCFAAVLWLIAYVANKILKNSELLVTDATTEESQFLAHGKIYFRNADTSNRLTMSLRRG